jgi:hypothetical protein
MFRSDLFQKMLAAIQFTMFNLKIKMDHIFYQLFYTGVISGSSS